MNLNTCLVVMAWSPFLCCAAQDSFPPSSSLSWLRNRVFGSRQTEERFVNRMAMAAQSLVALVNDPVVVNELRRYYDSLMRNPDIAKLVESIRPSRPPTLQSLSTVKTSLAPTTTAATTPIPSTSREAASTNEALVSTTASTNTATAEPSWMTLNVTSRPVNRSVDVSSLPKVYTSHGYRFYFDPRLLVQPLNSSSVKARVRRHLNLLRLNDVDNCVSFLICEMSRYPLRYGPLGVKVDRFFRYPMWDTGSSAAHYAAMARTGRRHGCRGRLSSCRYPIGPLPGRRYNFLYRNF